MARTPNSAAKTHDPHKHGNLAQISTVILSLFALGLTVYFRYADAAAKTSDEHAKNLIAEKVDPPVKEINNRLDKVTSNISNLTNEISNLKKAVETLSDNQSKETQKTIERLLRAAQEAKKPQIAARFLDVAAALVSELRKEKHPAPPAFFQSSIEVLNQTIPRLKDASFAPLAAFAEYRSSLNAIPKSITPPGLPPIALDDVSLDCNGIPGVIGIAARNPQVLGKTITNNAILNCTQILDGFAWVNVVFINTHIVYIGTRGGGGPVVLRNVQFVNCTFEIHENDDDTKQLLEYAALNETNLEIKASVSPNKPNGL